MSHFAFDRTFVDRVYRTLNIGGHGWCPFAATVLLAHLDSRKMSLWSCDLQGATEYEVLVHFACDALRERYDDPVFCDLYDIVRECNKIIEGCSYHAMISQHRRNALMGIIKNTDEVIDTFIRASIIR